MDGDMYDPNTASGKWVGTQPYYDEGKEKLQYPIQPFVLKDPDPEPEPKTSFAQRLTKAWKVLMGKE